MSSTHPTLGAVEVVAKFADQKARLSMMRLRLSARGALSPLNRRQPAPASFADAVCIAVVVSFVY